MVSIENAGRNYSFLLPCELNFSFPESHAYMEPIWTICFYISAVYVVIIFGLKSFMKNRPRYELKGPLVLWSAMLSIFSIIGALRMLPGFWQDLNTHGLHYTICNEKYYLEDKVAGFWIHLFSMSKVVELGDTIFIVLRKQPLIFLHWYHHITVMIYTWYNYTDFPANGQWFIVMNYCVHAIMYPYFTIRAMGYRPPQKIAMVITSLQISQMVLGLSVSLLTFYFVSSGGPCSNPSLMVKYATAMYFSYFVLFGKLFYDNYISKKKVTGAKVKGKTT